MEPVFAADGGRTRRESEGERMKPYARLVLVGALLICVAAPARADDKSDLQAKVSGALKHAKSFVATSLIVQIGISTTTVFVAPDRTKTSVATGGQTRDIVTIGDAVYVSANGAPFEKRSSASLLAQIKALTEVSISAVVPDITAGGVTFGVYQTIADVPGMPITLTCTYDKKTYLPVKCTSDALVQTFGNYDDPKNIIEIPQGAV